MISNGPNVSGYIGTTGGVTPFTAGGQRVAPSNDLDEDALVLAYLENFVTGDSADAGIPKSTTSATQSNGLSLEQMLEMQQANPDSTAGESARVTIAPDQALYQIENLVRNNRHLFQSKGGGDMTTGWNIAGQR